VGDSERPAGRLDVLQLRAHFTPRARLVFPFSAAVPIRGALGFCLPEEIFRPHRDAGPSGLRDAPRPFVLRVRHLDGLTFGAGQSFEIGVNLFAPSLLPVFRSSLQELAASGLGPGRIPLDAGRLDVVEQSFDLAACSENTSERSRDREGAVVSGAWPLFDIRGSVPGAGEQALFIIEGERSAGHGEICAGGQAHELDPLGVTSPPVRESFEPYKQLEVTFLTPTEIKGWNGCGLPPFEILAARARDRVSALCTLYGSGEPGLDFRGLAERAREVHTLSGMLSAVRSQRTSSRTGQTHPLSGFTGSVIYEGELSEFVPLLRAACFTGVGRQTVWGHGEIALGTPISRSALGR